MRRLYWRPQGVSRAALVIVALTAIAVLALVESFPVQRKQGNFAAKMAASRLSRKCMDAIKAEKMKLGYAPDPAMDPAASGMIGESITLVTSNTGNPAAKLTSTNPNFAAAVVDMLTKVKVGEGDVVAVGVSGSFPALNVSVYAALQTLKTNPIVIASASSSEWGANHVDYLWMDMDRTLKKANLVDFQIIAASHGGIDDLGIGMTKRGRSILDAAMERNGIQRLEPKSLADSISRRMALFDEAAGDRPVKAYINVGGGSASVGTHIGKKQFKPGLNTSPPRNPELRDSIMLRFAKRDVPVIHMSRIKLLAKRYGLPYEPRQKTPLPIGQGKMFTKVEYNRWLAAGGLGAILALMVALIRYHLGSRAFLGGPRRNTKPPEPMV